MMRHTLVALVTLILAATLGPSVAAQRPVRETELADAAPPQLPDLPGTDAEEAAFLAYARSTPASLIDPEQPGIAIDQWLMATLLPEVANPNAAHWTLGWCADLASDIPGPGPELCAEATFPISESKTFHFFLSIADARRTANGHSVWVTTRPPVVNDMFIQSGSDSLDVRTLSDLQDALALPGDKWPTVELEVSLAATPPRALPMAVVTFTIQVRNTGRRNTSRAEIQILVVPDGADEERYRWFPNIPVGHTAMVQVAAVLPEGRAAASALISSTLASRKATRERNQKNDSAHFWLFQITDPPEFGPLGIRPARRPNP